MNPPPTSLPITSLWVIPCTSSKHAVSCIRHRLAIQFLHDSIHVRMSFSQIIPPSLSPSESKSLLYTTVSFLLSCIQGHHCFNCLSVLAYPWPNARQNFCFFVLVSPLPKTFHNGVLLSLYKEFIWISSDEMDETGADYTEWSKPERKTPIQYTNTYGI